MINMAGILSQIDANWNVFLISIILIIMNGVLAEFNLSEKQAEAILDISLRRLTLLEVCWNNIVSDYIYPLTLFLMYNCFSLPEKEVR